jgi:hypothetical protein
MAGNGSSGLLSRNRALIYGLLFVLALLGCDSPPPANYYNLFQNIDDAEVHSPFTKFSTEEDLLAHVNERVIFQSNFENNENLN